MSKTQPSARDQLDRALTLLRRSLSFWKRAVVVFLVGVLLSVPYVFTRPRIYKSETVILYQDTIRSTDLTGGEGPSDNTARRVGARLREVLLSRASLEPIITDLGLYMKPGQKPDKRELIEAVDEMRKHVSFKAREGDTFEIAFDSNTAQTAQEVTKRLGDCIIQEAEGRRAERAKVLKEFLDKESDQNKADLRGKEADLAKFTSLHPLLAARLQGQVPQPVVNTSPASASGDPILAAMEARAFRIDRQLKAAAGVPVPAPKQTPFVPPPDSQELIQARAALDQALAKYTDKHPDVISARQRVKSAEAAQAAAVEQARQAHAAAAGNVEPPKTAADEAALRKELDDLQRQIALRRATTAAATTKDAGAPAQATDPAPATGDVALEVEFRRLQREVNEGKERQRQLDEKVFKASITSSAVLSDRNIQVSILDPAFLPASPSSRSRSSILAALLAVCIAVAIMIAIISARLDDRIYDRIDLDQIDVLPVLGVIPRAELTEGSKR
jgi:uncharacterized protein involved in exopolysaccharide biosynthesis